MNKDKINDVVNLLVGLQQYEWIRIKNIIDKELDLYTEKMLIDNCFNKELEYEIDTGIFRVFTRPL